MTGRHRYRLVVLALLLTVVAGIYAFTPLGEWIRQHTTAVVQRWPVAAPVAFIAIYALVGAAALPVWWLQVLAGACWGLGWGVAWSHAGAMLACILSVPLANGTARDALTEERSAAFERLRRRVGRHGLAVVTLTRLTHFAPFGACNYLFGASGIGLLDVLIGTVIGGTFSKMLNVAAGADPALLASRGFYVELAVVNTLLLAPLALVVWLKRPDATTARREAQ